MKALFIQDAAIDEYIAGVILCSIKTIELTEIIIVNGDCIAGPAMDAAVKIQQYIGKPNIPVSLAQSRSWNQFPWEYRKDSVALNQISCLANIPVKPGWPRYEYNKEPDLSYQQLTEQANKQPPTLPIDQTNSIYPDGNLALKNQLENALASDEKLMLVICCPLTTLREVLEANPELEQAIGGLIWMGGALFGEKGNLDPNTLPKEIANPYAEWNVFWDPYAVAWIFNNTHFPITLFPLNVTNEAKITDSFRAQLATQAEHAPLSKLAYQSYELVLDQPFYCMWDVTAISYLEIPEAFQPPVATRLGIVTDGYYQGTLVPLDEGRPVDVITGFKDLSTFYSYVLEKLNH